MDNHKVHWIPGYDHAGIATQVVVEKKIWNDRKQTRHDIGKDEFIKEVFDWKDEWVEFFIAVFWFCFMNWNDFEFEKKNKDNKKSIDSNECACWLETGILYDGWGELSYYNCNWIYVKLINRLDTVP